MRVERNEWEPNRYSPDSNTKRLMEMRDLFIHQAEQCANKYCETHELGTVQALIDRLELIFPSHKARGP